MKAPVALSLAGALAFAAGAAEAAGAAADPTPTRTVSYADLNLSTDAGARELLRRLDRAAATLCEHSRHGQQGLDATLRYSDCRAKTMDHTVRAIGDERLTRIHLARSGSAPATKVAASGR